MTPSQRDLPNRLVPKWWLSLFTVVVSTMMFVHAGHATAATVFAHDQTLSRHSVSLNNYFGQSVAVSNDGSIAVIGAGGDAPDTQVYEGSASVFVRTGGTWTEVQTLKQTGGRQQDRFGSSVAISSDGDRIVVGALYGDAGAGTRGAITVFKRSGSQWNEEAKISPAAATDGDLFGQDVDISADGTRIVAGAPGDGTPEEPTQGSIYIYKVVSGAWEQEANLWVPDGKWDDRFGRSVAISGDGNTVIGGAPLRDRGNDYDQGRISLFHYDSGTWNFTGSTYQPNGTKEDRFGDAIDIDQDGDRAAVGAVAAEVDGDVRGTATVLDNTGGNWTVDSVLSHINGRSYASFGAAVSLTSDGTQLLVGAPNEVGGGTSTALGDATLFRNNGSDWTEDEHLTEIYGRNAAQGFANSLVLAGDGQSALVGSYTAPVNGTQTAGQVLTFVPSYPLSATKVGNGYGTITSTPARFTCSTGCERYFEKNSTVTLTATPADGSAFSGWSGDCAGSSLTCQVSMTDAKSVTGSFRATHWQVSINRQGVGQGTVTSDPAGLDCGEICLELLPADEPVTLTATPADGSLLVGWNSSFSGLCAEPTLTCQIPNLTRPYGFYPEFAIARHLSVTNAGSGTGSITSAPAGIQCGASCEKDFPQGTSVTLTGTAAPGSEFDGWSGACSGTGVTCNVTMSQARAVQGTFTALHQFTITKAGTGTGRVIDVDEHIDCGNTCSATFRHGDSVSLLASPGTGSKFTGWSGSCSGQIGVCVVEMDQAKSAVANFDIANFTLSLTKAGTGTGTITSSPGGISCGATCSATFQKDTVITLQASPGAHSLFASWSGACTGNQPTCVIPITQTSSVEANFVATDFELSVNVQGSGIVTSTPSGIACGTDCSKVYPDGTTVTLEAKANQDATFIGWTGDCSGASTTCQVSMNAARSLTAQFTTVAEPLPEPPKPVVTIKSKPPKRGKSTRAVFRFTSSVAGSSFKCSLDKKAFKRCGTKTTFKRLKPGSHTLRVKASSDGAISGIVSYRWHIKKKRPVAR